MKSGSARKTPDPLGRFPGFEKKCGPGRSSAANGTLCLVSGTQFDTGRRSGSGVRVDDGSLARRATASQGMRARGFPPGPPSQGARRLCQPVRARTGARAD